MKPQHKQSTEGMREITDEGLREINICNIFNQMDTDYRVYDEIASHSSKVFFQALNKPSLTFYC